MAKKKLPEFETIEQEAAFWDEHDVTEYTDPEEFVHLLLPNLGPSMKRISLRMPEVLLARLKIAGHRRGVPYQSLLKTVLYEWLEEKEPRPNRVRA